MHSSGTRQRKVSPSVRKSQLSEDFEAQRSPRGMCCLQLLVIPQVLFVRGTCAVPG